jgi:hypothetical protein
VADKALKSEQFEASESTLKLVRLEAFTIVIITRFPRQEASCVLQKSCSSRLPQSDPFLDSPDPSKTQSTVGRVLNICSAPRHAVM